MWKDREGLKTSLVPLPLCAEDEQRSPGQGIAFL
jgi:hypothetical protein